jgi:major vault protein
VLDNNSNVQRVEVGPQTFTRQDHEKVILFPPAEMVVIPPQNYCIIKDPCVREGSEVVRDKFGQVKIRHGDFEIRYFKDWTEPFPIYPGETLQQAPQPLQIVAADTALRLSAKRDFTDSDGKQRTAGDEWLFEGPATFYPRVEVDVKETVSSQLIAKDHALKLQARNTFTDRDGTARKLGEEWLVRKAGAYLPSVNEKVLGVVTPNYILPTRALHLRAVDNFTDVYGKERKAGEEWLVTHKDACVHLQDVNEDHVGPVNITVLTKQQYCVVLDPVGKDGKNNFGARELRQGEQSFFLLPGERLEGGINNVYVLSGEEALLLRAKEAFVDGKDQRTPGDLWMIRGPTDYVPPVEVEVVETRRNIPLDENEGIYVRDTKTGTVTAVSGQTYLLQAHEELWEKPLTDEVEKLLNYSYVGDSKSKARDKSRVLEYRVPHNAAVQIYDYKKKKSRVEFGPSLVMLQPEEQFTVLSLSGDKPKRPNAIKSIALQLGPDFMTDILEVESSDHARLRLRLSYNWHFGINAQKNAEQAHKLFQVRDFVGDACKAIASRVRGAVAAQPFDQFHQNSASIIRKAVFGVNPDGKINDEFIFTANSLTITNIDIQSVEPVDERTRESLQKSVQLAIEITTKKQERNARHEAEKIEQEARGKIERQKVNNMKTAESARQELIKLQGECAAVASTGTAKAEAEAKAEYLEIEGEADVKQAELHAVASAIEAKAELAERTALQTAEVEHTLTLDALRLKKAKELADIETEKFGDLVQAIKPQTIKAIAKAGPEMQARLLKGLGLKGYLMTDGNSPINLFNAAKGMVQPSVGGMPAGFGN